jgi:hypothetical protein
LVHIVIHTVGVGIALPIRATVSVDGDQVSGPRAVVISVIHSITIRILLRWAAAVTIGEVALGPRSVRAEVIGIGDGVVVVVPLQV